MLRGFSFDLRFSPEPDGNAHGHLIFVPDCLKFAPFSTKDHPNQAALPLLPKKSKGCIHCLASGIPPFGECRQNWNYF